jgi:hypothetical protein
MSFGRSKSPPPPPPPPPAPAITPQKSKTKDRAADAALRKKGQASSNVTGGAGLLTEAPTSKPSLLGQNKMSN